MHPLCDLLISQPRPFLLSIDEVELSADFSLFEHQIGAFKAQCSRHAGHLIFVQHRCRNGRLLFEYEHAAHIVQTVLSTEGKVVRTRVYSADGFIVIQAISPIIHTGEGHLEPR